MGHYESRHEVLQIEPTRLSGQIDLSVSFSLLTTVE